MNHPDLHALLELVDGNPAVGSALQEHLAECSTCRSLVENHRTIRATVRTSVGMELPPEFSQMTARAIESRARTEREWGIIERTAERFLAVAALIVILVLTLAPADAEPPSDPATLIHVYVQDSTIARLVSSPQVTREDVLETVLYRP